MTKQVIFGGVCSAANGTNPQYNSIPGGLNG